MKPLKIAANAAVACRLVTDRPIVALSQTDFTDVGAVILSCQEIRTGMLGVLLRTGFEIPAFVVCDGQAKDVLPDGCTWLSLEDPSHSQQIELAIQAYYKRLLPPFFDTLSHYVSMGNASFACPGHQGGHFFLRHPAGRQFHDFYGEHLFRSDICNADVQLGDLLIHEGAALAAQKYAAKVFNADQTFFVLNGTSAANKVVTNALLAPNDLVLFDRNNHKSVHHGALIQAGATPIYLETERNSYGFIGGINDQALNEANIREKIRCVAPERAEDVRPFRLAVIQLATYDGTLYNARQVVQRIGHLCDYILFDSAWAGYEQFIDILSQCSPLLLTLTPDDPGIIVTQSVHKQLAGFSQASQIHKKDAHLKGQARYCNHRRFNNAFMLHASTSPFYPIFAALEVNARIHEGACGRRLWYECMMLGIDARKALRARCAQIRPFIPDMIDGRPWEDYPTEQIAQDERFFACVAGAQWHAFEGYANGQYLIDPCKLLLTTPGVDAVTGHYTEFGVPATLLAHYLRSHGIIPEKTDLYSILFLLTPAENEDKIHRLIDALVAFEEHLAADSPLCEVLPHLCDNYRERYRGYTLRQLCQEMHDINVRYDMKALQKSMFQAESLPDIAVLPQLANQALIRGNVELLPLAEIKGRVAAEGALPYPPGILCVVPGEVWSNVAWVYFMALEEMVKSLPGLTPELQGVKVKPGITDASSCLMAYVVCDPSQV
ncbi:ornithine decarboxylase [Zymobacter sp. IVIA_12111.31 C1]|uniref:ornithine decarboxylase n=1 Tax=Zymobacter sp. IVIA_12111.31 C1 TaxID=3394854 RepID=UPI0039C3955B